MGASSSDGGSCSRMADASLDGARLAFSVVCRTKALAIIRWTAPPSLPRDLSCESGHADCWRLLSNSGSETALMATPKTV